MSLSNFNNRDGILEVKEIRISSLTKSLSTEINDIGSSIIRMDETLKKLIEKIDRIFEIDEENKTIVIPHDYTVYIKGNITVGEKN